MSQNFLQNQALSHFERDTNLDNLAELNDVNATEPDLDEEEQRTATQISRKLQLDDSYLGQRFDQIAAKVWSDFSRERLKNWLLNGELLLNGQKVKPKARSNGNELMTLDVTLQEQLFIEAQNIDLDIVYQDDDILVVNKPVGMVVHPGAGNSSGTLVNALLYHFPQSRELARAGLVHRIDKDTSGLLVIAKNLQAQHHLSQQLANKSVFRIYDALCYGQIIAGGTVDAPIKRHPVERTKMAVLHGGREAVTHYRVLQRFEDFTLVQAQLETGRTHQIRVHLSHIGHALVGDQSYARLKPPKKASETLRQTLQNFKRQALHARKLGLIHPRTGQEMNFEVPMPEDMQQLIAVLAQEQKL
ncbi:MULTISPECIES: 23S rRNA pseudouridine(1911/1915/1917) synthase RluD [unclassified Acinetobacter]|uniref:23S rRNA pseudouridine(1911/1915/1917) synthase RluD n=1 Tax=unclassified Acinetobacter TaxID=196816 RepID=UPI0035BA9B0E